MRHCSKPSCNGMATVVLGYSYADRRAVLEDAVPLREISLHDYALCTDCADALTPPRGWALEDRRHRPPLFVPLGDADWLQVSSGN